MRANLEKLLQPKQTQYVISTRKSSAISEKNVCLFWIKFHPDLQRVHVMTVAITGIFATRLKFKFFMLAAIIRTKDLILQTL